SLTRSNTQSIPTAGPSVGRSTSSGISSRAAWSQSSSKETRRQREPSRSPSPLSSIASRHRTSGNLRLRRSARSARIALLGIHRPQHHLDLRIATPSPDDEHTPMLAGLRSHDPAVHPLQHGGVVEAPRAPLGIGQRSVILGDGPPQRSGLPA